MIESLLSYVAPHLCCGCGEIGVLLCDNCKYDIENDAEKPCLACGIAPSAAGVCQGCKVPYSRAWYVGERSGVLQRLIGDFKFQNMRAAYRPLATLLMEAIDQLPENTIVVPIPTVPSHVRERGYDHTLLLAKQVAEYRGLRLQRALSRLTSTKQRDATRAQRLAQAKAAFAVRGTIDSSAPYLLIDDIVTTGATVEYAAHALQTAGVRDIWVAVIARQPLD
jgi:ComF family protein